MTGIVAHTYPEWWLKLTGQAAHWSTDYSMVLDAISNDMNSSSACDYIFIANERSVLCEVEKITNADILKAYVQLAYDDGLIAKSA